MSPQPVGPKRNFAKAQYDPKVNWHAYEKTPRAKQEQKIQLFCEKLKDIVLRRKDG